ncbi:MAG: hypothetical protein CEE38_06095 [Planctomycetes bacterium B3_Pla]|nr:MAG: hypothetical protein CEE38_06095 [Planctomycetes bacterium B3_Pla]
MRIRWENIFGPLLLIFGIYLFVKIRPYLDRVFEDLADGYYYRYDPMLRIIIFGLVCVTIVAVAKIISKR